MLTAQCRQITDCSAGDQLKNTATGPVHRFRQLQHLFVSRKGSRNGRTRHRAMPDRPRCRKPDSPGCQRFFHQLGHPGHVRWRRWIIRATSRTHHIIAQSSVRNLGGDIEGIFAGIEIIHILRKTLPSAPRNAFIECRAGDILDPFHHFDQFALTAGGHRRKANAAIAHHHGRDPVSGRGIELIVPANLAVVVGMNIDKTGRDNRPLRIKCLARRRGNGTCDLGDATIFDADIAHSWGSTQSINKLSALDQDIKHPCPFHMSPTRPIGNNPDHRV